MFPNACWSPERANSVMRKYGGRTEEYYSASLTISLRPDADGRRVVKQYVTAVVFVISLFPYPHGQVKDWAFFLCHSQHFKTTPVALWKSSPAVAVVTIKSYPFYN